MASSASSIPKYAANASRMSGFVNTFFTRALPSVTTNEEMSLPTLDGSAKRSLADAYTLLAMGSSKFTSLNILSKRTFVCTPAPRSSAKVGIARSISAVSDKPNHAAAGSQSLPELTPRLPTKRRI